LTAFVDFLRDDGGVVRGQQRSQSREEAAEVAVGDGAEGVAMRVGEMVVDTFLQGLLRYNGNGVSIGSTQCFGF